MNRRTFLMGLGASAALLGGRRTRAGQDFKTRHVVLCGIGGGLRQKESLGMAEGATMPNLFGKVPLVKGMGGSPAGPPRFAPEYAPGQRLVLPAPLATPLYTQGTLLANLRYAEGAPGHLQGQACLLSGAYNNIDNRADAHAPAPTLFELHRQRTGAAATDAFYVSLIGGFYRSILSSDHPDYGERFGGTFLSPPRVMSILMPLIVSGKRSLAFDGGPVTLPAIQDDPKQAEAVRRLSAILDANSPAYQSPPRFSLTPSENAAFQRHLAAFYGDPTGAAYFPQSYGIGMRPAGNPMGLNATGDSLTMFHAEQVLLKFRPAVMFITLLDIDACHTDFNGYLAGQLVADACVRHLWETIQSTDGLRDQTTLLVLPEHGRHLFMNGENPDSLGRSGIDHGQGDDGDRDVFLLALGPDVQQGRVIERTGISQPGRSSGRYETIDATLTAATLLGHGEAMAAALSGQKLRPGIVIEELLR